MTDQDEDFAESIVRSLVHAFRPDVEVSFVTVQSTMTDQYCPFCGYHKDQCFCREGGGR